MVIPMKFPLAKDFSAIYVLFFLLCAPVFGDLVLLVRDQKSGRKTPPALPLRPPCWDVDSVLLTVDEITLIKVSYPVGQVSHAHVGSFVVNDKYLAVGKFIRQLALIYLYSRFDCIRMN